MPVEATWRHIEAILSGFKKTGRWCSWEECFHSGEYVLPSDTLAVLPPEGGSTGFVVMALLSEGSDPQPVEVVDVAGKAARIEIPNILFRQLRATMFRLEKPAGVSENAEYRRIAYASAEEMMGYISRAKWQPLEERMPKWLEYVRIGGAQTYFCNDKDCEVR